MLSLIQFFFLLAFSVIIAGCSKNNSNGSTTINRDCGARTYSYSKDITPIISTHCGACHINGSNNPNLGNYSSVKSNASKISATINQSGGANPMPQGASKLPDSTITKIDCWIKNGTPNN